MGETPRSGGDPGRHSDALPRRNLRGRRRPAVECPGCFLPLHPTDKPGCPRGKSAGKLAPNWLADPYHHAVSCARLVSCRKAMSDLIGQKSRGEQAIIGYEATGWKPHNRTNPWLHGGEHEHPGSRRHSDRQRIAGHGATFKSVPGTDKRRQGSGAAERFPQYEASFAETPPLALSRRKASALWQPESPHIVMV